MTKKLPTLYKQSSTGKVQQWRIWTKTSKDGTAEIFVEHGQVGGKLQLTSTKVKAGKNLGKANATTAKVQAESEADSKWRKQLDKGYTEQEGGKSLDKRPMLAHDYEKYKHQVTFPAFVQKKLDGIRCIAHRTDEAVELVSRMGKPITTMSHIAEQLIHAMEPGEIWDGELYIHGMPFQQITSLVKRRQAGSESVEYHVYDCIDEGVFEKRYGPVDDLIHVEQHPHIKAVSWAPARNHAGIKKWHDQFVAEGYEGAMVRHSGCEYKAGYRSRQLLKCKMFLENDFVIMDASEGKGKFEGMAIFTLQTKDGAQFDCMPKGTEEQRREFWTNRKSYIGKRMVVRFFEWTNSTPPVPRFPVGVGVRFEDLH